MWITDGCSRRDARKPPVSTPFARRYGNCVDLPGGPLISEQSVGSSGWRIFNLANLMGMRAGDAP
jgi:hypothetical protein